jgi:hypothetical protein
MMRVRIIIAVALLLGFRLYAQQDFSELYYSDKTSLVELITPCTGAGEVMYFQNFDTGFVSQPLQPWYGSELWRYAPVPSPRHIGFRNLDEGILNPIFAPTISTPLLESFTPMMQDPTGDAQFANAWLDLTNTRVSFTEDRIYYAIDNAHASFPVSSDFTYYAYMPVLVNPFASPEDDPPVFGLMYTVSLAGIIGPGLYKITGTGFGDLIQIGNIEHGLIGNTLVLSCAFSDLIADPDFSSWYNPDYPLVATMVTTSRITLTGGTQPADETSAVKLLLRPRYAWPVDDFIPQLSNAGYEITGYPEAYMTASVLCTDLDNNFPSYARIELDGVPYSLHPIISIPLEFSTGITWQTDPILLAGNWEQLRFVFSYGEFHTFLTVDNPVSNDDLVQAPDLTLKLYPNPVRDVLQIEKSSAGEQLLRIFNIKGQLIQSHVLSAGKALQNLQVGDLAAGIYLLKTDHGHTYRMLKL